jgi:predicted O-methyltransferase YrrM
MKLAETIKRMGRNSDQLVQLLKETVAGIKNQSSLFNDKHREIVEGLDNQSQLLNAKLQELIEATANQSRLLNDKLMAIVHRQDALMELHKLEIAAIREMLSDRGGHASDLSTIQVPPVPDSPIAPVRPPMEMKRPKTGPETEGVSFDTAVASLPLMLGDKTYNTSHPDYDANLVRNFPGKIFNAEKFCDNIVYANVKKLAKNGTVADAAWRPVLDEVLEEAKTVPHADQVFERRAYIENYIKELTEKYGAHYSAGWVNLDDALFLYWLVRKLKPKTVVQTGVCNGLSSAFMMLALVKNGSHGSLHVIDLPPVFEAKDAGWTVKGRVYGVVIPEGKSSGWMVPDAYRNRFEVWTGDAKVLLPKMIDKVDSIDLFYHDSDHTYNHMMFEFREAKRKLKPGGLIVGDDVSWNASVWDFADQYGVPSYNFKGAVGVAFF